jgi:hypothetical protein
MNRRNLVTSIGLFLVCMALPAMAFAASATIVLDDTTGLTNVNDAAGTWQINGGTVSLGGSAIGYFQRVKRIVTDATPLNVASITITIFLTGGDPPQNITIQGAHSFNNGQITGSVSAASSAVNFLVGARVSGTASVLTIEWD